MADYAFYLTPVETFDSDIYSGMVDIEDTFDCRYQSFTGLMEKGDANNVYTEEYKEGEQLRVYTPSPDELVHASTECKLTLLWLATKDGVATDNEMAFQDFVFGRKMVWYDTFRKKYFLLLMQKQPSKGEERLYGKQQWRQVTYTFTNLAGKPYDTNPITSK